MVRLLTIIALMISLMATTVIAPVAYAQPVNTREQAKGFGPRKQLATIIFAGLAGAILGLSTLSFYGRPQDKLSNIAVGFAVGVISGTAYTTYKAATQPREFYGLKTSSLFIEEEWPTGPAQWQFAEPSVQLEVDRTLAHFEPMSTGMQWAWSF